MLSAAELDAMRVVEEEAMTSTGYILAFGTASNGMGGFTETWGTVGTVACDIWMRPLRSDEITAGGQPISRTGWYITVPHDTTITAKDRFESGGRTFEITQVPNTTSLRTAKRIEAIAHNEERRL